MRDEDLNNTDNIDDLDNKFYDTIDLDEHLSAINKKEQNDLINYDNKFIDYDDSDDEFRELLYKSPVLNSENNFSLKDFEEIDNENNLSTLGTTNNHLKTSNDHIKKANNNKSHLEQKGYVRRVSLEDKKEPQATRLKRKSTKNIQEESQNNSNFYLIVLIASICVCIAVFILVFSLAVGSNSNKPSSNNNNNNASNIVNDIDTNKEPEITEEEDIQSIGVIENIATSGSIQFFDIEAQEVVNLKYVANTKLSDQYGKPLVIEEFKNGDVVNYKYNEDSTSINEMSLSKDEFNETKVSKAVNDIDEKTLMINNKLYYYSDRTIIDFDRGSYSASEISDKDVIDISGYDDQIYYINVVKGHGDVHFSKNSSIQNGIIEIDTTESYNIDELTTITLSEGPHKIVVKGDNIDPYVTDILVKAGETTEVSLDLVQQKQGLFVPSISPAGSTVQIDGDIVDTTKPILLNYGPHTITVSKDGYNSFQNTFNITSQETRINVTLEQKVLLGKLNITTDPAGADVYIDNALVGKSPVTQPVEYGNHTIMIRLDGYIDISYPVEVTDTKTQALFFNLQKKTEPVATETDSETITTTE